MDLLRAPLGWVKWGGLTLALSCSSVDSSSDKPNDETDNTPSSGGEDAGDGDAAGGDGDGDASGGSGDGDGAGSSGDGDGTGRDGDGTGGAIGGSGGGDPPGSGGAVSTGCRSDAGCTSGTGSTSSYCVEPEPSAVTLSNITDPQTCQPAFRQWCERCSCPPAPQICETDANCSDDLPYCRDMQIGAVQVKGCSECQSDEDCGGSTPRCVLTRTSAYECRPCAETSDCAEGACTSEFLCSPSCETDADCVDSVYECSSQRCERRTCESDADCPEIARCGAGGACERLICANDEACGGSPCVKGQCFEVGGSCTTIYYPF